MESKGEEGSDAPVPTAASSSASARQRATASSPAAPPEAPALSETPARDRERRTVSGGLLDGVFGLLSTLLSPVARLVGATSSPPVDAESAARQFVNMFATTYGDDGPPFQETSYGDVLAQASASTSFVLIYLHSSLNQDHDAFARGTLRDPTLVQYMRDNFIVWGGDVSERFAYEAAQRFAAPAFPFIGVYVPVSNNKYRRVFHHEGMSAAPALLAKLRVAVDEARPAVDSIRAEQIAREEDRRLREEQNVAYEQALAADRERDRLREQAAEQKELEEAKELSKQLNSEAEVARARERVEASVEPPAGSGQTSLRFTMPNGVKLQRRFNTTDTLELVFDFVLLSIKELGLDMDKFQLSSNFPRKTFTPADDMSVDMKTAGLHPQAVLFVTAMEA